MKVETFLAKFYDVRVLEASDIEDAIPGERHIELYEKGEDTEPLGWFVKLEGSEGYEWRRVYGNVASGTVYYGDAAVKAAAKARTFIIQPQLIQAVA